MSFLSAAASAFPALLSLLSSGKGGGKSDKLKQIPTMNPLQQRLFQQQGQQLLGGPSPIQYWQQLLSGSPEAMSAFEDPYRQQFEQETIPNIAERFAGAGALSSSGFGQALGAAGGQLQTNLAALRASLQGQAAQGLQGQLQGLLGMQPFAYHQKQRGAGVMGGLGSQAGDIFGPFASFLSQKLGSQPSGNQFPLTSGYDMMFRQQGLPLGG